MPPTGALQASVSERSEQSCKLAKPKRNVDGPGLALGSNPETAFLKQLKHRLVVRQDFGSELAQPRFTGNGAEMTHQSRADT
jgi:hypothetical protein